VRKVKGGAVCLNTKEYLQGSEQPITLRMTKSEIIATP